LIGYILKYEAVFEAILLRPQKEGTEAPKFITAEDINILRGVLQTMEQIECRILQSENQSFPLLPTLLPTMVGLYDQIKSDTAVKARQFLSRHNQF